MCANKEHAFRAPDIVTWWFFQADLLFACLFPTKSFCFLLTVSAYHVDTDPSTVSTTFATSSTYEREGSSRVCVVRISWYQCCFVSYHRPKHMITKSIHMLTSTPSLRCVRVRVHFLFLYKVGGEARLDTPTANVTALRMRFPKDRQFVFDVEYSYRVDGVFADFSEVSFIVDEYWPVITFPFPDNEPGASFLGRRNLYMHQYRVAFSSCRSGTA